MPILGGFWSDPKNFVWKGARAIGRKAGLTEKMKNFCREYLACSCNATEAYVRSYNTSNRKTATVAAGELMRRDDIKEYIEKLKNPYLDDNLTERERIRALLWDIATNKEERTENVCRALDLLNKMEGNYVVNNVVEATERPLKEMSTEDIKEILQLRVVK